MAGKHVAALEAELEVRLLQRSTRKLHLTDAGTAFYARSQRNLGEFDEARREASDAGSQARGLIRIAAPVTFGALHLTSIVSAYLEAHPGVHAEVLLDDRYADLLAHGIDVAVRIGTLPDSDPVARTRQRTCQGAPCAHQSADRAADHLLTWRRRPQSSRSS